MSDSRDNTTHTLYFRGFPLLHVLSYFNIIKFSLSLPIPNTALVRLPFVFSLLLSSSSKTIDIALDNVVVLLRFLADPQKTKNSRETFFSLLGTCIFTYLFSVGVSTASPSITEMIAVVFAMFAGKSVAIVSLLTLSCIKRTLGDELFRSCLNRLVLSFCRRFVRGTGITVVLSQLKFHSI